MPLRESEFTSLVSRALLCYTHLELYDLGVFSFTCYKSLQNKRCVTRILVAFTEIYENCCYNFTNVNLILKRFANTFSKGFANMSTENIKYDKSVDTIKIHRVGNNT